MPAQHCCKLLIHDLHPHDQRPPRGKRINHYELGTEIESRHQSVCRRNSRFPDRVTPIVNVLDREPRCLGGLHEQPPATPARWHGEAK